MLKQSLGLIETEGLAAGVEAADTAVKAANVTLVGYELTMGGGWTTIKILGDVGAVKAAVSAAAASASRVGRVVSTQVIARPSESLEALVINKRTLGSMPGARADVKGNSPLSASYVAPAKVEPDTRPQAKAASEEAPKPASAKKAPEKRKATRKKAAPAKPGATGAPEASVRIKATEAHKPVVKPSPSVSKTPGPAPAAKPEAKVSAPRPAPTAKATDVTSFANAAPAKPAEPKPEAAKPSDAKSGLAPTITPKRGTHPSRGKGPNHK